MNKNIRLSQLFIDTDNPRHEPILDEKEIIKIMLEKEGVEALAKDIVDQGSLNPLEMVGVIAKDNENYIVVEGNRRTCALKLITDPSLAPNDRLIKKFSKLREKAEKEKLLPFVLSCHVFDDRESARDWLIRRHGGEQKGIGVKNWDPLQSQRFTRNPSYNLATSLLEYAKNTGIIDVLDTERLVTTVARTFSTPEIRYAFGITSKTSENKITLEINLNDFNIVLKKYFLDLLDNEFFISSRSTKEHRMQYLKKLEELSLLPITERLSDSFILDLEGKQTDKMFGNRGGETLEEGSTKEGSTEEGSTEEGNTEEVSDTSTRLRDPYKRKYLFNHRYELKSASSKLKKIYQELKDLVDIHSTPYAVSTLFRVFIELSCDYFIFKQPLQKIAFQNYPSRGKSGTATEKSALVEKIYAITHFLEKEGAINEKMGSAIKSAAMVEKGIGNTGSIVWLHSSIHNYQHSITPNEIFAAYDNFNPFLNALWAKLDS